jgi:hypothetical protein
MDNAIVDTVSSEATNHIAENAINLEANFAWEANEASAQHVLTIDLQAPYECDCLFWVHHEIEQIIPTLQGVTITLDWSHDTVTWTSATLADDDGVTEKLLKVATFTAVKARYWKVTFKGTSGPFFYAPNDMRISACWLGTVHDLDKGPGLPLNDEENFLLADTKLPFGKVYTTGFNINSSIAFSRQWALLYDSGEYAVLRDVITACNGSLRPFVYDQSTDDHLLCQFSRDTFDETLIDTNLYSITVHMLTIPIVQRDEYH